MKLREYLNSQGISVSDFAVMIGTAQPTVSGYLLGTRPNPRPEIAKRIISATNGAVTWDDLYGRPTIGKRSEAAHDDN